MATKVEPVKDYLAGQKVITYPTNPRKRFSFCLCKLTRDGWLGYTTVPQGIAEKDTEISLPLAVAGNFAVGSPVSFESPGIENERALITDIRGDTIIVERKTPRTFPAGCAVRNLNLVRIEIQRSINGIEWETVLTNDTPGGPITNTRSGLSQDDVVVTFQADNPKTLAAADMDGDLRVRLINQVPYRTKVDLEVLEASERTAKLTNLASINNILRG